jgi:hypothetical protein
MSKGTTRHDALRRVLSGDLQGSRVAAASSIILVVLLLSNHRAVRAQSDPTEPAMAEIRAEAIRANMRFLADDLLEGRGTRTRGHELAAKFVATQFEQLGLQPAGDAGTYFQNVRIQFSGVDETKAEMTLIHNDNEERLMFRKDFLTAGPRPPSKLQCSTSPAASPHPS